MLLLKGSNEVIAISFPHLMWKKTVLWKDEAKIKICVRTQHIALNTAQHASQQERGSCSELMGKGIELNRGQSPSSRITTFNIKLELQWKGSEQSLLVNWKIQLNLFSHRIVFFLLTVPGWVEKPCNLGL